MAEEIFSYSRLTNYSGCPRQFWFNYRSRGHLPEEENKFMRWGLNFHKFAEDFHKNLNREKVLIEGADYLRSLKTPCTEKEFEVGWQNDFIDTEIERFMLLDKHGKADHYFPVHIERMMYGEIGGVKVRGVVDRIDRLINGAYATIDYKPQQPWDLGGLKKQLVLYAELAEQNYDYEIKHMGAYFYKTKEVWFSKIAWQTRKSLENFITKTVNEIENDEEFNPKLGNNCNWCGYKKFCFPNGPTERQLTEMLKRCINRAMTVDEVIEDLPGDDIFDKMVQVLHDEKEDKAQPEEKSLIE